MGKHFFSDSTIAAAMLDRLLHRSVVFTITGDSYRLPAYQAQARKQRPNRGHYQDQQTPRGVGEFR